ncbi:MAG: YdaS family helix-turn-helix protein [Nitrospirales bacterium]|nr:YdaS family helix-turn-helix protein [Nitrospirales bacterium]
MSRSRKLTLGAYALLRRGNLARLARALDLPPSVVSAWAHRRRPVPVRHCLAIEQQTAGLVRAETLRPDVSWRRTA